MKTKNRKTIVGIVVFYLWSVIVMISSCGDGNSSYSSKRNQVQYSKQTKGTQSSYSSVSSSTSSEGYGEYHNVYTGERQDSYKGSVEQQEDIATLDKMIEEGY